MDWIRFEENFGVIFVAILSFRFGHYSSTVWDLTIAWKNVISMWYRRTKLLVKSRCTPNATTSMVDVHIYCVCFEVLFRMFKNPSPNHAHDDHTKIAHTRYLRYLFDIFASFVQFHWHFQHVSLPLNPNHILTDRFPIKSTVYTEFDLISSNFKRYLCTCFSFYWNLYQILFVVVFMLFLVC